jgi:hypothetical protein
MPIIPTRFAAEFCEVFPFGALVLGVGSSMESSQTRRLRSSRNATVRPTSSSGASECWTRTRKPPGSGPSSR